MTVEKVPYSTAIRLVMNTCTRVCVASAGTWNCLSDRPQLPQLVKAAAHDAVDVVLESQLAIHDDASAALGNWSAVDDQLDDADLFKLSGCTEQTKLRLLSFPFQSVEGH